ncbi:methyltransferase [Xylariaceae sp. FL0804]|nr:methyltransferase [Xylariaceae sp. FL0804]
MATEPQQHGGSALPATAEEGFRDATAYDAHRPSYPPAAVDAFLARLGVASTAQQPGDRGARIVEIAAGTGKFTDQLAARPEGFEVRAVEPHAAMRRTLADKRNPGVEVLDGTAAHMPVGDGWGDACIAAQAFHWFATPEALKEIHRVLRPGAVLGAIWNVEDYNKPQSWEATTTWEQKLNDFVLSLDDGQARFRHLKWKEVFENQTSGNPVQKIKNTLTEGLPWFSLPLGEQKVSWTVWLGEEALWSRFNTLSQIAVMEGDEREAAVKLFKDVLKGDDVERNEKGEIAVHGVTYFVWTDRI